MTFLEGPLPSSLSPCFSFNLADPSLPSSAETMPVNLYPLTWLLSDGRLFLQVRRRPSFLPSISTTKLTLCRTIQAGWQTTLLDYVNNIETRLPNISHAQRFVSYSFFFLSNPVSSPPSLLKTHSLL